MTNKEKLKVLSILEKLLGYVPHRYGAFSVKFNDIEMTGEERYLLEKWFKEKDSN